jgi:hypothetical protein
MPQNIYRGTDPLYTPAAVRLSLPEANPAYSLTAALAVTFPFNITFGIPLFFEIAKLTHP